MSNETNYLNSELIVLLILSLMSWASSEFYFELIFIFASSIILRKLVLNIILATRRIKQSSHKETNTK